MESIKIKSELVSELYEKELIAFGTGKVGRVVMAYLEADPKINLIGVTNSRITEDDAGLFEDTGLTLRSLSTWKKMLPNATILAAVLKDELKDEVREICKRVGFEKVIFIQAELVVEIAYSRYYNTMENLDEKFQDYKKFLARGDNSVVESVCLANEIRDTHKSSFSEYKGCNRGKNVVIVACGPTMNCYTPIQSAVHIGVNAAFKRKDLKLDFYFAQDYRDKPEWYEDLCNYDFVKFFGVPGTGAFFPMVLIPESIIEENGGRKYFCSCNYGKDLELYRNIEYHWMMESGSVTFSAIQFAIYTRPKRIFLVGCDCGGNSHFDGTPSNIDVGYELLINGYKKVKEFVERFYPDTEIISVNPVRLKGMFHDVYTESYLEVHPEIDRNSCEIWNIQNSQ